MKNEPKKKNILVCCLLLKPILTLGFFFIRGGDKLTPCTLNDLYLHCQCISAQTRLLKNELELQ